MRPTELLEDADLESIALRVLEVGSGRAPPKSGEAKMMGLGRVVDAFGIIKLIEGQSEAVD